MADIMEHATSTAFEKEMKCAAVPCPLKKPGSIIVDDSLGEFHHTDAIDEN